MILELIFWTSVAFVLYVYIGYPAMLALMSLFIQKPVQRGPITPSVSFIITAYNEEKRIREKLQNTLGQDYLRDRFEIVVA